jgi:hypothetical protein
MPANVSSSTLYMLMTGTGDAPRSVPLFTRPVQYAVITGVFWAIPSTSARCVVHLPPRAALIDEGYGERDTTHDETSSGRRI